jgi:hypothetical protein
MYKYDGQGRISTVRHHIDNTAYSNYYVYNDRDNFRELTYPSFLKVTYQRYDNERVSGVLIDGEVLTKNVTYLPFGPEVDFVFGTDVLTVNRTYYDNYYRIKKASTPVF